MDSRHLFICIFASWWLCLECTGLLHTKDLKHAEIENESLYYNSAEDVTFNETGSVTTDGGFDNVSDETTSHLILEKTTKNLENFTVVTAVESKHHVVLVPLAVGGLALLSGLLFLAFIVGIFMYCNRNTGFVYEPAPPSDTIIDV
ncbi:uncharacterized protein LOC129961855 [Argiope bruennichi]|uniref:Uncharacterized protein n=1 Tax=Argiope bruennichi TaxID=94029 RepID=A0A8T0FU92_ARGBR|nr:uncharacterized protein LOC129961855 [Argiope bruennichi]KAF8794242.1 hypothetical protein HNY73_002240 [Argiope bruennichi]